MDLFRVTSATLVGYLHATRSGNKTAAHRPAHITLDIDGLLPFSSHPPSFNSQAFLVPPTIS